MEGVGWECEVEKEVRDTYWKTGKAEKMPLMRR